MAESSLLRPALSFPKAERPFLEPYLPSSNRGKADATPFVTLTFATSLDSQIALSPGAPTMLSGPQSKAMTHYLRSRHSAILIGVGTAIADNPSLNCRLEGVGGYGSEGLEGQPRPIILDPTARWEFTSRTKIFALASEGRGKAPYIITGVQSPPEDKKALLEQLGGRFITLNLGSSKAGEHKFDWSEIMKALGENGLQSVMIEGGAVVINSLLEPEYIHLVNSVILTIAPTWLGRGGVVVSPARRSDVDGTPVAASRLQAVQWHSLGEDVVLCGHIQ
ncbi:hypothetical protein M433DRAFT_65447 [Acidomyces richmondensis BFW]|nr:MAG: hypothetical protein FE78DRAFT_144429 [Acidomyces sp. 'richmondensis']KYG46303.1 hypothetical protein M433DRAFT_65447 [Acidomyces richmondensis BFW]